jgi:hypothetical protein
MVLAGDVELQPDRTAQVASQSNGQTVYHLVDGECSCKDYPKAPAQMCKHRLAYGIYTRAEQLVAEKLRDLEMSAQKTTHQNAPESTIARQDDSQAMAIPYVEAPASANTYLTLHGYRIQLTIRGADAQDVLTRLLTVLVQYPLHQDTPADQQPQAMPAGWCQRHGVAMTRGKDGKHFYHKVGEKPGGQAVWCRGK